MVDLTVKFKNITSPNPFWLASAPPTNSGDQNKRALDAGWGGAVWKTLGNPIVNVSSRYAAIDYGGNKGVGLNNTKHPTDRGFECESQRNQGCKKHYPKHALIVFSDG